MTFVSYLYHFYLHACIAKYFSHSPKSALSCYCCDICARKCTFDVNKSCQELLTFFFHDDASMDNIRIRRVSKEQLSILETELHAYKVNFKASLTSDFKVVSSPSVSTEFSDFQVKQVLEQCEFIFSTEDFKKRVEIWRCSHANNIMNILCKIFKDIDHDVNLKTTLDLDNINESEIDPEWLEMRDDSDMNLLIVGLNVDGIQNALDNFDTSTLQSDASVTSM